MVAEKSFTCKPQLCVVIEAGMSIRTLSIPTWSMLTKWELTKWESTKWEVDELGIDKVHLKTGCCTVKTFELLQPYFDHLSCMPVVYVTRYKLQGMLPIWLKAYE